MKFKKGHLLGLTTITILIFSSRIAYSHDEAVQPELQSGYYEVFADHGSRTGFEGSEHFSASYNEARSKFLDKVRKIKDLYGDSVISSLDPGNSIKIESKVDEQITKIVGGDLSIDWVYIPASTKNKTQTGLVLITSGVHGGEGYAGSAFQSLFMQDYLISNENAQILNIESIGNKKLSMGVLLIHAVNPFGMKYFKRYTENRVDLNRNFLPENPEGKFKSMTSSCENNVEKNWPPKDKVKVYNPFADSYFHNTCIEIETLRKALYPQRPVVGSDLTYIKFLGLATIYGSDKLIEAAIKGQYKYPKGLYFGGKAYEPNAIEVKNLIRKIANEYKGIYFMDVHTGVGKANILHPFGTETNLMKPQNVKPYKCVFNDFSVSEDEAPSYMTSGDILVELENMFPQKIIVPVTLEYGTEENDRRLGLPALVNTVVENQAFHFGYKHELPSNEQSDWLMETVFTSVDQAIDIYGFHNTRYQQAFYPSDSKWRQIVISEAHSKLQSTIPKFTSGLLNNFSEACER